LRLGGRALDKHAWQTKHDTLLRHHICPHLCPSVLLLHRFVSSALDSAPLFSCSQCTGQRLLSTTCMHNITWHHIQPIPHSQELFCFPCWLPPSSHSPSFPNHTRLFACLLLEFCSIFAFACAVWFSILKVEFLLKTDSGYPKDTGVNKPWQPLGIPFAITTIGQLYQSPPSPIPGDLGRGPSHQSHVFEHRDTHGQAQVCSKGLQGSSVDRPCQPSLHWIKFWHVRNPLPQSIRLRLSVLVR